MNPYAIRKLRPGDRDILEELAVESAMFGDDDASPPARPLGTDHAAAFLVDPAAHLWIALVEDRLVGFALAYVLRRRHGDPTMLFLYELGVRSGWRRRGVATALVGRVLDWAREAGVPRGFVLTGEGNAAAIAFYESLGWHAGDEGDLVYRFRTT